MTKQRFIFTVLIGIMFTGTAIAQVEQKIEHRVQRMKEALQLTDEQSAKIQEIFLREEQKTTPDKQSKPLNKRTALKKARLQMKATDTEIEKLLTPEQLKKYDSYKKERMNELKSRTKGRKFKEE
jgi:periplasmic protein CpxP/Spy